MRQAHSGPFRARLLKTDTTLTSTSSEGVAEPLRTLSGAELHSSSDYPSSYMGKTLSVGRRHGELQAARHEAVISSQTVLDPCLQIFC